MRFKRVGLLMITTCLCLSGILSGCQSKNAADGKTVIELVQYKPEAAKYFDEVEDEFNRTHDDIQLKIESPNDANTILRTRFIREDYPDIIGIGGDMNFSYYMDAGILMDIKDYKGLSSIKSSYLKMDEALKFVPSDGVYAVPYAANAAGVLYNKDLFEENGWEIPTTWKEFTDLCKEIQDKGMQPLYFGYKDTWTCLAPWNALAVSLAPADVCQQVNNGKMTFTEEYEPIATKLQELLQYGEKDPFAYSYNDACTAFANGESVMYTIGSYAVPQILSVNPDLNVDSFVMPACDNAEDNVLNSGIDLQFCVTSACPNKEAAYEVLDFLIENENLQKYADAQNSVPCKDADFKLASMLDGMSDYIKNDKMKDYQDHYYPSEMAVDAQIQTFLIKGDKEAFLKKFDKDWIRYNEDIISKVKKYNKENK